jgi:hypothetical protein
MPTAPNRTVLEARNETTSDISRWPKKKPGPEMSSGRRTTTNTPNIITDRCLGTEKGHRRRCDQLRDSILRFFASRRWHSKLSYPALLTRHCGRRSPEPQDCGRDPQDATRGSTAGGTDGLCTSRQRPTPFTSCAAMPILEPAARTSGWTPAAPTT